MSEEIKTEATAPEAKADGAKASKKKNINTTFRLICIFCGVD